MKKKTIVIAEDHTLVREGIKALLDLEDEYDVIAEAEDGLEAVRCVDKFAPDLILLDLAMPKMNGISAIKEIKKRFPGTKILALTIQQSEEYILEAFKSGADGYCLKHADKKELQLAIKSVLGGNNYLSPEISGKVLTGYIKGKQTIKNETSWENLTQREKEILKLIGEGYTSKEISDLLCISDKTVDKHRYNIMNKLDIHNASGLTAYAIARGLVHPKT